MVFCMLEFCENNHKTDGVLIRRFLNFKTFKLIKKLTLINPECLQQQAALDQFKMEAAREVGVNLKQGYNGDLTSKEAGSVGGQMVKTSVPYEL